jgi:hypothetical protein
MPGPHAPAITLPDPLVRDPVSSRARRLPMTWHPLVAIPDPSPISAQPHVARYRRDPDYFLAGRRRSHHHDAARGMPLIGDDDAAGESRSDHQRESPAVNVRAHGGDQFFELILYRNVPVLGRLTWEGARSASIHAQELRSYAGMSTPRTRGSLGKRRGAPYVMASISWAFASWTCRRAAALGSAPAEKLPWGPSTAI